MAIARMQKISIVTEPSRKEDVLYALQTLQSVEVTDLAVKLADTEISFPRGKQEGVTKYEELYNRTEEALRYLSQYRQKVPLKQKIAAQRPRLTMNELHQQVNESEAVSLIERVESLKKEREDIQDLRDKIADQQTLLGKWQSLPLNPAELKALTHFDVRLGTIPNDDNRSYWNAIQESKYVSVSEIYSDQNEIGVVAVTDGFNRAEMDRVLVDNHFQTLDYEFDGKPSEVFAQLETKRKALIEQENRVVEDLQQLQNEVPTIKLAAEEFFNRSQREIAARFSYDSKQLVLMNGWVPEEKVANLKEELDDRFKGNELALIIEDISEEEIDNNEVPIVLKNNSLFEPFEMVIEMFSLPNYREIDPTNWVAVFYMLFFAMMMGDLGYGILLWLATLFALKVMDLKRGTRRFVKFGHILSYPTMLIGLVYGSFFGINLPFQLINPTEDALLLMGISIGVGFLHIVTALCLSLYLQVKKGNYATAYNDALGWLIILLGLLLGIIGFAIGSDILLNIGVWTAIIGAAGIIIVPIITQKNKAIGAVLGIYNLYGVSGYIGDFVSYTRLMALGIAGGSIAMAFNILFSILPTPVRFTAGIVLIVVLQLFNMFLSLLSAYVHSLRLVFVEFFGKFFEGGGKAFKPIRTLQNYVSLKDVRED